MMSKILIDIQDQSKKEMLISLLRELQFVKFHEIEKISESKKTSDFRRLFGIWKGRDIQLSDLREKAWKREI